MAKQYQVEVSPTAQAGLDVLPGPVASAAVNFMRIHLQRQPDRAGVELRGSGLKGCYLAQRGQYRIVYKIDGPAHVVHVLQILSQH